MKKWPVIVLGTGIVAAGIKGIYTLCGVINDWWHLATQALGHHS